MTVADVMVLVFGLGFAAGQLTPTRRSERARVRSLVPAEVQSAVPEPPAHTRRTLPIPPERPAGTSICTKQNPRTSSLGQRSAGVRHFNQKA